MFLFLFLWACAKHQNNWCSDWATLQKLVEEIFGRGPSILAKSCQRKELWSGKKWPYGPIVEGCQLWRCFSFRASGNDGFLLNTLKTLFRLSRVLLDV